MNVKQIAETVNEVIQQSIGESELLNNDLSNVVAVGQQITNFASAGGWGYDNFVKSIIDKVGRVIVVDRPYAREDFGLYRDSWEYGSGLEKIRITVNDFEADSTWQLTSGTKYDDILVYEPPTVSVLLWNNKFAFRTAMSYAPELVIREAFTSPESLIRFISGIESRINNIRELALEQLQKTAIVNLIACKYINDNNVVNILQMYNSDNGTKLTPDEAIHNAEFIRYAVMRINMYRGFISRFSMLYNDGGYPTFTPTDDQKLILLTEFVKAAQSYLYSNAYNRDDVTISGNFYETPYWQGSGTDANIPFSTSGSIDVTANIDDGSNVPIARNHIIGTLFDRDAVMLNNENYRVTSFYNADNETTKYYYKFDGQYCNDIFENCVVFTADYTYRALTEQPADWVDNYSSYYVYDEATGAYKSNTSSTFTANKIFSKSVV